MKKERKGKEVRKKRNSEILKFYKKIYSKEVIENFLHPKNVGEIKDPDGVGVAGNPICGDILRLYIKVKDNKIEDIKFQTLGCAAALACSSMVTELAKGKKIKEAMKITSKNIEDKLGRLPPIKVHCSNLGAEALHNAIEDYLKRRRKEKKRK